MVTSVMKSIDLNADLGEGGPFDDELLQIVSSCNIACGGHAGDEHSMRKTVQAALANGVAIGAHPSYPDREGFGRRPHFLSGTQLRESLLSQIEALDVIAHDCGAELVHVKLHGALYNDAAADIVLAETTVEAVVEVLPESMIVGLPGSELERAAKKASLGFVAEGFVDRAYVDDGRLMPRSEVGAVHQDIETIAAQAVSLVAKVETLCIHGDTPAAASAARRVRVALQHSGVEIRAIGR